MLVEPEQLPPRCGAVLLAAAGRERALGQPPAPKATDCLSAPSHRPYRRRLQAGDVSEEAEKLHRMISAAKNHVGVYYRKAGEQVMLPWFQSQFGTQLKPEQLSNVAAVGAFFDRRVRALGGGGSLLRAACCG